MRANALISVTLGLALAAGLFLGARILLETPVAAGPRAAPLGLSGAEVTQVFVATRPIQFGEAVDADAVIAQPWPRALLPETAVTEPETMFPQGEGWRRARAPFVPGEVILGSKLSERGDKVTGIALGDPNNQAKALNVSSAAVAGGMVMPGDLVDVLLIEERLGDLRAVTVAQRLRVLAVEGNVSALRTTIDRTVVVEVTQSQGQSLALAQQAGSLSIAVRTDPNAPDRVPDPLALSELRPDSMAPAQDDARQTTRTGSASTEPGVIVRRGGVAVREQVGIARN